MDRVPQEVVGFPLLEKRLAGYCSLSHPALKFQGADGERGHRHGTAYPNHVGSKAGEQ